jgi:hypothetical protein
VSDRMTLEEWETRGAELFGPDKMLWRFVCPSCGHIQAPEDFRPYKDKAEPSTAYFSCIGRFDGHMRTEICSGESPCNYAGGGFIPLNPLTVVVDGKERKIFAFDEGGDS